MQSGRESEKGVCYGQEFSRPRKKGNSPTPVNLSKVRVYLLGSPFDRGYLLEEIVSRSVLILIFILNGQRLSRVVHYLINTIFDYEFPSCSNSSISVNENICFWYGIIHRFISLWISKIVFLLQDGRIFFLFSFFKMWNIIRRILISGLFQI